VTPWPRPSLRHLAHLTDDVGIFEHAHLDQRRVDLGYCTDDAGRLLGLASTMAQDPDAHRLATVALEFLRRAHDGDGGTFRLRLGADGQWTDDPASDDASGRALLGLGTAASAAPWPEVRSGALQLFDAAAPEFRSVHTRAVAYAALGAVAVVGTMPGRPGAQRIVDDAAASLYAGLDPGPGPAPGPTWPWPEPRLTYANALIPEACMAVGAVHGDPRLVAEALALLEWLVEHERRGRWFSFTPVGGQGPGEAKPGFDQQPIEAWAMADACARAYAHTGEDRWAAEVARAADWFSGDNDIGIAMFDPITEGGFDGLEAQGVNRNQGAESTLAFVATMARAQAPRLLGAIAPL
jgi:hypothetical protein